MNAISHQEVILTYRAYARVYDWLFGAVFGPGRGEIARTVAQLKPCRLLEVGVGTGLTLADYPPECSVVGIDLSHEMLRKAQERADALPGRDIRLAAMDAEHLEFPDDSFDCVTLPYVLSVTPNPQRLVEQARRVCKPDGSILIVNHFSGAGAWELLERPLRSYAGRLGFRSEFSFDEHILQHDWQVLEVRSVNLLGLSKFVHIRNR